jgi:GNAT superfamily N-acetyltransferase
MLLPSPAHFVAVAERSGSLLGWVAAERRMLLESGERAELVGLVVGAAARRAGVGKALVSAAEQWATAQQLKVISVRSNIARLESHPFYESIGYARKKTQHSYAKELAG